MRSTMVEFNEIGEIYDFIKKMIDRRKEDASHSLKKKELTKKEYDYVHEQLSCMDASALMSIKMWDDEATKALAWIHLQLISMFLQQPELCYNFSYGIAHSINAAFAADRQDKMSNTVDNGTIH